MDWTAALRTSWDAAELRESRYAGSRPAAGAGDVVHSAKVWFDNKRKIGRLRNPPSQTRDFGSRWRHLCFQITSLSGVFCGAACLFGALALSARLSLHLRQQVSLGRMQPCGTRPTLRGFRLRALS